MMKKSTVRSIFRCFLIVLAISLHCLRTQAESLVDYVDPRIGSGGHGHVFVGANVPFGAVQAGPSNFHKGWDWCSGYHYDDKDIVGFSQTHLSGTGCPDLCDVFMMPYMGKIRLVKGGEHEPSEQGYSSPFSHENETVCPGYYAVKLDAYGIDVELTASERVAFHKYRFPEGEDARVVIDLWEGNSDSATDNEIELVDEHTILGKRFSKGWSVRQELFFAIRCSLPIKDFGVYESDDLLGGEKGKGRHLRGLITFAEAPKEVAFKIGISPVSSENALENIEKEIPDWDFDNVRKAASAKWEKELRKIRIETKNEADKKVFYTAMYHLMMHPSVYNDCNGDYKGADYKVHRNADFTNYTVLSLWDTYRAAHPLYILTNPDRVGDFINTMIVIYEQTGVLPVWHLWSWETGTMVGISSMEVVAEACLKNCKGIDRERAYKALKGTAMSDARGMDYVRELKFIPSDSGVHHAVANAMEIAIGDASIALLAERMGKSDDYDYFTRRAQLYKLYYDADKGFMRGRMKDGSWNPSYDPFKTLGEESKDYAEGNAWQYLWLVPHDVYGLMESIGGEETFNRRLDEFFALETNEERRIDVTGMIGQYAHGNEPSHHIGYLYPYGGRQWKTAALVRRIMSEFYTDKPDGLIGNEDCGQMSAWYVFSALGFYPVFTASGEYVIGSPIVDKATLQLDDGKIFTVEAENNAPENVYVQSVELNGKPYPNSFLRHEDLMKGGSLKFTMGVEPNVNYGTNPENRPGMSK